MKNQLTEILVRLADAKVDFVVAGGVAAVLHGVERLTMDLDIALRFDDANMLRFLGVMADLRMKPRVPVAPEALLDKNAVKMMVEQKNAIVFTFDDPAIPFKHVDVFLTEELSHAALSEQTQTVMFHGRPLVVVSMERLLEIKKAIRPPRPKDAEDIEALERLLGKRA